MIVEVIRPVKDAKARSFDILYGCLMFILIHLSEGKRREVKRKEERW